VLTPHGRAACIMQGMHILCDLMPAGQHASSKIDADDAISAAQCRGARAMIEMSRADLADIASVGQRTIADFESGARTPIRATLAALRRALEAAGVEFLSGSGVRLKAK